MLHPERETGLAEDVEVEPLQGDIEAGQAVLEHVTDEEDQK